jgi:hypothetical protein
LLAVIPRDCSWVIPHGEPYDTSGESGLPCDNSGPLVALPPAGLATQADKDALAILDGRLASHFTTAESIIHFSTTTRRNRHAHPSRNATPARRQVSA